MCTSDYIRTMVNSNEAIYIDTASLMDAESMELFINNAEWVLLNEHRKIIVPRAVCLELTRHLGSQNSVKKNKAVRVLEMLGSHGDIFEVHNENLREEEALNAFADSELLAELTLNRTGCGQLLITNDRRLSEDAYKLNEQASCRGYKVMVCFINRFGDLRRCECARTQSVAARCEETPTSEATASAPKSPAIIEEQPTCQPASRFKISQVLIPRGAFAAGLITCKYGKTAVKYIKSLF